MKATKLLPYFVIAGLLIVLLLQRQCTRCPDPVVITHDTTIYKIITVFKEKTVYKPKPYAVIDTVLQHDTVFKTQADTSQAIKDYSLYKKYDLALIDDSTAKVNCLVDVQFNKIAKYTLKSQIFNKIIEHEHYIYEKKRNKVFAGFQIGYSIPETSILVTPTLQFLTKKDNSYIAGYEPFKKIATFGMMWKINLKK